MDTIFKGLKLAVASLFETKICRRLNPKKIQNLSRSLCGSYNPLERVAVFLTSLKSSQSTVEWSEFNFSDKCEPVDEFTV